MNNALPWALDGREKVLIGLNFSTKKRRPDDWVIEREDGSVVRRRECVREQATDQVAGHDTGYDAGHDTGHDTGHDVDQVRKLILIVNRDKKSREEIMELLQLKGRDNFRIGYLAPAMEAGYITMTLPDKLKSKKQRYYLTEKGLALLEELKQGNNG